MLDYQKHIWIFLNTKLTNFEVTFLKVSTADLLSLVTTLKYTKKWVKKFWH